MLLELHYLLLHPSNFLVEYVFLRDLLDRRNVLHGHSWTLIIIWGLHRLYVVDRFIRHHVIYDVCHFLLFGHFLLFFDNV